MKNFYQYLDNPSFLKDLVELRIKQYFIKITVLTWDEETIENIEGRVISGNINIDGQSSIRRTANLSIYIDGLLNNITNINSLLSLNKKINLEIGFTNTTDKYIKFPILWFPLGVYVIVNCSISNSDSGLVASLQLKDKMCLLNGECGGTLSASTIFDNYETVDKNGQRVVCRPTIYQIIRQLVNHIGGEQLGKIIISDLDTRVKQVMKWEGEYPLYFLQNTAGQYFMTIDGKQVQSKLKNGWSKVQGSPFSYGQDVGYILTDFSFPGDLIGDAGNSVTDILDKIKEVLGNYEYFYDINGNFVFQEIKNFLNNSQTKYILDALLEKKVTPDFIDSQNNTGIQNYLIDVAGGTSVFQFKNSNLITSYNNNPQYGSIKNDYIVWGTRIDSTGQEFPIRYHLAIDKKPKTENTYEVFEYEDPYDGMKKWHKPLIFKTKDQLPKSGVVGLFYMVDDDKGEIYKWDNDNNNYRYIKIGNKSMLKKITSKDWRTQLYLQGVAAQPLGTESNYYYTELLNQWPKLYDIEKGEFREEIFSNYSTINYFLDFIDTNSSIGQMSVKNIGRRTKVLNEGKNVNCIFEAWVPDIILIKNLQESSSLRNECELRGYNFYQVPDSIYDLLSIGGSRNSAYQVIRQLLHEYTSYNETVSLQTLPIYHLQPNTRIEINDDKSNIYGDYIINSLSFSFDENSLLTINASRVLEKI